MLVLVLGDNLPVMFIGWEGVGLCCYLLIGFWYDEHGQRRRRQEGVHRQPHRRLLLPARDVPAVLVHRDAVDFPDITRGRDAGRAAHARRCGWAQPVAFWAALFLFIGARGKSAQIPLYVWLPDAMAGPTPVSALIHAATMVTAGVYMVARMHARLPAVADGAGDRRRRRRC